MRTFILCLNQACSPSRNGFYKRARQQSTNLDQSQSRWYLAGRRNQPGTGFVYRSSVERAGNTPIVMERNHWRLVSDVLFSPVNITNKATPCSSSTARAGASHRARFRYHASLSRQLNSTLAMLKIHYIDAPLRCFFSNVVLYYSSIFWHTVLNICCSASCRSVHSPLLAFRFDLWQQFRRPYSLTDVIARALDASIIVYNANDMLCVIHDGSNTNTNYERSRRLVKNKEFFLSDGLAIVWVSLLTSFYQRTPRANSQLDDAVYGFK